jgi:hypothetical protein
MGWSEPWVTIAQDAHVNPPALRLLLTVQLLMWMVPAEEDGAGVVVVGVVVVWAWAAGMATAPAASVEVSAMRSVRFMERSIGSRTRPNVSTALLHFRAARY